MFIYIYMYLYIYICIYIYIYVYIYIYIYVFLYIYIYPRGPRFSHDRTPVVAPLQMIALYHAPQQGRVGWGGVGCIIVRGMLITLLMPRCR